MTRYIGAAVVIVLAGGMGVLAWLQRRRERLDAAQLAQDKRQHTYRFEGHDEGLAQRADLRRRNAEKAVRDAAASRASRPTPWQRDQLRRCK